MSERPYLSIGEVLGLLLEEFPDVTISKIRFLESQGLIDPERTASGYRKFYDLDVERLRFILREQKDNYLPLKVIRDRLDSIDYTLPNPPRPIPSGASWLTAPADEESVTRSTTEAPTGSSEQRAWSARPAAFTELAEHFSTSRPEPDRRSHFGDSTGAVEIVDVTVIEETTVEIVLTVNDPEEAPPGASSANSALDASSVGPASVAPLPAAALNNGDGEAEVDAPVAAAEPTSAQEIDSATQSAPAPGLATSRRHEPPRAPAPAASQVGPSTDVGAADPVGPVSLSAGELNLELTADELCQRATISPALLKDLEVYGLVAPRLVSGMSIYGLDALRIATAAGRLSEHGLEPRHLRSWRTSVDREIGLIEQLVQPLVRQRNPQARAQAAQRAEEMIRLGGELRNALIRMEIQSLIAP